MSTVRTPAYLIANHQLAPALPPSVRLILDITSSQRFSHLPHRTIFVRGSEKSRPVPINFIHNFSDLVRSGATTLPCGLSKHIA